MSDDLGMVLEVAEERVRVTPLSAAGLSATMPCVAMPIYILNTGSRDFYCRYACTACGDVAGQGFREGDLTSKPSILVTMEDAMADFEQAALRGCPKLAG